MCLKNLATPPRKARGSLWTRWMFSMCAVQDVQQPAGIAAQCFSHRGLISMHNTLTELHEWLFFHHRAKVIELTTTGRGDFFGILLLEIEKMSSTLATVLFINASPYFCCFLWNVWVLRKQTQKPGKQSQNVMISYDIRCACSAAARKTRSLHRWEASIHPAT